MPSAPASPSPTVLADQAKSLGLGVVELTAALVAQAPTDVLPLPVVEGSRIFPYQLDGATQTLSIAVADPARLKQAAPAELQAQRKLGRRLRLELVDPATFDQLLPEIRKRLTLGGSSSRSQEDLSAGEAGIPADPASRRDFSLNARNDNGSSPITHHPSPSLVPTIDLASVTIPRSVFLKIPHDVATKFRIVAFAAPAATRVKLATDRPSDPGVKRVLDVIRAKRGVTIELHQAVGSQIDDLIDMYASSVDPISLVPPQVAKTVSVSEQTAITEKATISAVSATLATKEPQAGTSVTPPSSPATISASPMKLPTTTNPPTKPVAPPTLQPEAPVGSSKPATPPPSLPTPQPAPTSSSPSVSVPAVSMPKQQPTQPTSVSAPSRSPLTAHRSPNSDAMPVDTSPVTTSLGAMAPTKIQLAAPLPNLTGSKLPPSLPTEAASQVASSQNSGDRIQNSGQAPDVGTQIPNFDPRILSATPIVPRPVPVNPISLPASGSISAPSPVAVSPVLTTLGPVSSEDQNLDTTVGSTIRSPAELEAVVKTGLVPKLLAGILQYAVNTGASDIHVEAETGDLRIRFRVDGQLRDILKAPIGLHAPLVSRLKILAKMKIDEQRVPQDGRFGATTANREIDFRVSTLPAIHGEKVVMRILDKSTSLKAIDQLGIDGVNGQRVTTALAKPFGIILVTGPTGSGKTTTLYAMLATVNKPGVNIVTLEDPVEYELPGITQTQVKPKIGFSFAEGLRSILRQDPDVIMVGEIRDRETASLATHAALTGHLVLSTLHTNNAAGAIPRFLDMGVEPFLIASSMEAVIGQRLVRKLCEHCRQPAQLSAAIQQELQAELARSNVAELKAKAAAPLQLFAPKGCDQCHDGYRGRIGIYEVMTVTPEIETLTAKKAPLTEIETLATQQGMVTMKQDGIGKALAGFTSIDEILRVTTSD